ncbi:MAG: tRNA (adenosine(37)-N6)-threonylcarbamoyltransferase complex dimerization subunit type 1 TsaB [Planctomycetota bacterium]
MTQPHQLAIETSSRRGAVALGRGEDIVNVAPLPDRPRASLDLMAVIDTLTRTHGVAPRHLNELYVSLGPGSFTGLRIAVSTAKVLARSLGVKLVGVPTLDVLRAQYPDAAVALNVKRDTAWSAAPGMPPDIRTLDELRATGRPLVADTVEGATPAEPDVRVVHRLGRSAAAAGRYDDPLRLSPFYIRQPEAVTLWEQRHGPPDNSTP